MPDAQSTTEWTEQANVPIDEIEATTPEEILALVTAMESGMWATDAVVSTEIAGTNASGTVVGFARTTIDEPPLLRATDLRFDMRNDAGTWHIVAIELRFHWAGPTATEFCQ